MDLFKQETIGRFVEYFRQIVQAVISNPDTKIADIEMITGKEKNQLLFEFNNTAKEITGIELFLQYSLNRFIKHPIILPPGTINYRLPIVR